MDLKSIKRISQNAELNTNEKESVREKPKEMKNTSRSFNINVKSECQKMKEINEIK